MQSWLKDKLMALLSMALSQRTIAATLTFVLVNALGVGPELAAKIAAALAVVLVASFAHRPPGAPVAATGLSPSLKAYKPMPPVTPGGIFQQVDAEDPRR